MLLDKYINDLEEGGDLIEKLKQRVLLRTQLDVVYTDLINWERSGLISIGDDSKKGKWKHISYNEYVWIKIVEDLRNYGFSYEEILIYKDKIHDYVPAKLMLEFILNSKEELNKISPIIYRTLNENKNNSNLLKNYEEMCTFLDLYLLNVITFSKPSAILFFKNTKAEFVFLSKKELEIENLLEDIMLQINKTHLSISLNNIVSKFITTSKENTPLFKTALLNEGEYILLKELRNRPESVSKISIRFKEQEIDLIEIETIKKKVEVESRLMDHIKKGEYSTIQITSQDGRISSFTKKEKIKL